MPHRPPPRAEGLRSGRAEGREELCRKRSLAGRSVLPSPELRREEYQEREQFEAAEEHEEGEDDLGRGGEVGGEGGGTDGAEGDARDVEAGEDRAEGFAQGEAVEGHDEGPDGERGNVDEEEAEKGQPEAFGDDPVTEFEECYGLRVEHAEDLLPGVAGEEHNPHDLHAAARGPRARADGHKEEQDALREGAPALPVRSDEARARAEARALEEAVEERPAHRGPVRVEDRGRDQGAEGDEGGEGGAGEGQSLPVARQQREEHWREHRGTAGPYHDADRVRHHARLQRA